MASTRREDTHYDVLGIGPDASADQVKSAYRRKVLALHPDGPDGNPEAFQRVLLAYEVLGNEAERARYDAATGMLTSRRPAYPRSFSRLFDSLFSGLRSAVHSTTELSAGLAASDERTNGRRRAG